MESYRRSRSRSARWVSLTWYATSRFEGGEDLSRRPDPSLLRILKALANALARILTGGKVEKALIGLSSLYDKCGLSLHGKNKRALGLFQEFCEGRRLPPETGE